MRKPDRTADPAGKESGRRKAERILAEELGRRGLGQDDLPRRRKAKPEELESAQRLRGETTTAWAWTVRRLGMGAPGSAAKCPRRQR
jgi:hypothetical protein